MGGNRDYYSHISVTFETTGESVICFCKIDIGKSRCWRIYRATTRKWHQIWMWFEGSVKVFGVQIEIIASVFDWISKQKLNLSLFLWDSYRRKLGLMDLPGHDGKVTSDINFILSPYYRSFRADRDVLYESLLNSRLLWAKTWNNEYESEYESVSWISV